MKAQSSKLRNITLYISYDGADFAGYELQPGKRTIRGELENALQKLFRKNPSLSAVSRTDAGVHALAAIIFLKNESNIPTDRLPAALNSILPEDVRVLRAEEGRGRPIKGKTYEYLIFNGPICPPLIRRYVWHVRPKLNLPAMKRAAKALNGKHDFTSFCATGDSDKDHNKNIQQFVIRNSTFDIWRGTKFKIIRIEISANGYLYKMVRNMVGTLVDVGLGRVAPEEIKAIIIAKDRKRAGRTAPARGLCLTKISFKS